MRLSDKPLIVILVCFVLLLNPHTARADIAPPPAPPGSNIAPSESTQVRMVSEEVVIEIRAWQEDDPYCMLLRMYGPTCYSFGGGATVSADFHMRNRGDVAETILTRFPLVDHLGRDVESYYIGIIDFMVWVDNQPVDWNQVIDTITIDSYWGEQYDVSIPWAEFEITYPPQKAVDVRVTYTLPGRENRIYAPVIYFDYIFRTGAGWYGTIGQADLIVRLPYRADQETLIRMPIGGSIQDNNIHWTWKDFEPTEQDDFQITLIDPGIWQSMLSARSRVQANPEDGNAWFELGKACEGMILDGKEFVYKGLSGFVPDVYIEEAVNAFAESARLLPNNPAPHLRIARIYLGSVDNPSQRYPSSPIAQKFIAALNAALAASNDSLTRQSVEEMYGWFTRGLEGISLPTPGPSPTIGPSPTPLPTSTVTSTRIPQATRMVARRQTPAPSSPTVTMAHPTETPTPVPDIATVQPESTSESPLASALPSGGCANALFVGVIGLLVIKKKTPGRLL